MAAPASVIPDRKNEYYESDEECLRAIGEAMRTEYRMIVDAGFLLQLDDARAAVTYDRMVPPASFADYRDWVALHVEVLNHAIEGIPPERIRYHVCWGSWPGPHTTDVPLRDIVDLILQVSVGAYVIEGANPRHEHEWKVWQDVKLPAGKVLIPGVISHATNIVEHPELVAERIVRLARAGRAREPDRRNRLRLCAGPVPPPRPSLDHVGEARGAGRRRAAGEPGAVELNLRAILRDASLQRCPQDEAGMHRGSRIDAGLLFCGKCSTVNNAIVRPEAFG